MKARLSSLRERPKVEAAMAIYRHLNESPQEVVLQVFIEGASLTSKDTLTS